MLAFATKRMTWKRIRHKYMDYRRLIRNKSDLNDNKPKNHTDTSSRGTTVILLLQAPRMMMAALAPSQ